MTLKSVRLEKLMVSINPGTVGQVVYEFRYSVDDQRSGVVNDRWEQRVGQFVKGSYSLLEPSGMIRTVNYEVDGRRGFVAVVRTHYPGE